MIKSTMYTLQTRYTLIQTIVHNIPRKLMHMENIFQKQKGNVCMVYVEYMHMDLK